MIVIATVTMERNSSTKAVESVSQRDYIDILNKYVVTASRIQAQQAIDKIDKQIQGTIIAIEDAELGKYKIQYQDSVFYAYSQNDKKYSKKDIVYISIPENDMSQKKYILGEVAELKNEVKILKTQNYFNNSNFCYFDLVKLPIVKANNFQTEFTYMYIDKSKDLYVYTKSGYVKFENLKSNIFNKDKYMHFLYDSANANENLYWKISFTIDCNLKEENSEIYIKTLRNFKKHIDFGCKLNMLKKQKEYLYNFNLDSLEGIPFVKSMNNTFYIPIKTKDEFLYITEDKKELESLYGIIKLSFFVNLSQDVLKDEDNFYIKDGNRIKIKEKVEDFYEIFKESISLSNLSIELVQEIE